jgi:Mlc titration factor MtfA (ptsG expression regulator)
MFGALFGGKKARRARLRATPIADDHRAILQGNVPWYERLASHDRRELEGHVQVFLDEKRFEATAGFELNDVVRVTIAGHACLLIMHRPTDVFPTVRGVLVRPTEYVAERSRPLWNVLGGMAVVDEEERLGEAGQDGVVVLAWDEVIALVDAEADAVNVVAHEFAHELDREDGAMNGAPVLTTRAQRTEWARVCEAEFRKLQTGIASRGALDEYGAEDPAEFFAVATEAFLERPVRLRRRHPELYDQLRAFYRLDTAAILEVQSGRA